MVRGWRTMPLDWFSGTFNLALQIESNYDEPTIYYCLRKAGSKDSLAFLNSYFAFGIWTAGPERAFWMLMIVGPQAANMSDRRAAAGLLGGLGQIFPTIKTVIADAGNQSRKLARLIKAGGYELRIVKRRKRAFEVVGLIWIVERTFASVSSHEQGLRAACADL